MNALDIQSLLSNLNALAEGMERVRRGLRQYSKLRGEPFQNVNRLRMTLSRIEKASESLIPEEIRNSLQEWLSNEKSLLEDAQKQLQSKFGRDLEDFLKQKGFELRGQYPRLQAGFYTIKLDFELNEVRFWYGPEEEFISSLPLDAERVADTIMKFHEGLTKRPFDDMQFLKELYMAYMRVLNRDGRQGSEKIPITSLMVELAYMRQDSRFRADPRRINFRDYGRVLFSYDMYRLTKRDFEGRMMMLTTATRLQVKNRERYLWIPSKEKGDGTVYSLVHFGGVKA